MSDIVLQNHPEQLYDGENAFPSIIIGDSHLTNLGDCLNWLTPRLGRIKSLLSESGAILFRGFPIASVEDFDSFSGAFQFPDFTYQESLSNAVRVNHTQRVFTANEAPKDVEIFLHHEMAQTPIYPSKLFFFCQSAAEQGGATPICRSDKLLDELEKLDPALVKDFADKGVTYTTYMAADDNPQSGQGRGWRGTLSVDGKDQAEAKLRELGYSWQWLDSDRLKVTTPVLPAVKTAPSGKKVFFNQLLAAYLGWKGVRENPSRALAFGDGSPISAFSLDKVAELSKRHSFDIPWQDGDVALVDNYLAMHGRRPYSGERPRKVLVTLAGA